MYQVITIRSKSASFDLRATSPEAARVKQFALQQKAACKGSHAYYGQFKEDPSLITVFVHCTVEDATAGVEADVLDGIAEPSPTVFLTAFEAMEDPSAAFLSPAAEVLFLYFPEHMTPEARTNFMEACDKMRPTVARSAAKAVLFGWAAGSPSIQRASLRRMQEDGKGEGLEQGRAQVFVNVVGWDSIDAHQAFQDSEEFGANIHHVFGVEAIRGADLMHIVDMATV